MALRKPLVLNAGTTEQIQAGDVLDAAVTAIDVVSKQNDNASPITIGQPVYVKANGNVDLAKADAIGTAKVSALVRDASIAAGVSGYVQTDGILSCADWTAVIGAATLTTGSEYYLDEATAGLLTTTAPATGFITYVGLAISTTDMQISPERPIKL